MKINKTIKFLLLVGTITITGLSLMACQEKNDPISSQKTEESNSKNDSNSKTTEDYPNYKEEDKNDSDKEPEKTTTDLKEITYYTYDINTEQMTAHTKMVGEISVTNIVKELSSKGIIPSKTSVNTAKVKEENGVRTLYVDLTSDFVNFDQGASSETLSLQAFANSVIKSFNVDRMKLTIDGANYSGGHIAHNDNDFMTFKQ